ncbi:MAG TPA: type II toxin-antitoxin system VapC family toxin [Acidimicrobiales bacterium]|nr:type II toxin-antitoxin system VapC family toxin [Acidimicrobiales bacterium]
MRLYLDSSALTRRSLEEPESGALESVLDAYVAADDELYASSLAWIEVSRAIRRARTAPYGPTELSEAVDVAMSGITERPITLDVVGPARRLPPDGLRSLHAVHLATAILLNVDAMVTYDARLTSACQDAGLAVLAPGR